MIEHTKSLLFYLFLEMSEALSNSFENPLIVKHDGGHYLPANSIHKQFYQKFIKTQLLSKYNETGDVL